MIRTIPEFRARVDELRNGVRHSVALVSTIGSLHEGHAELVRHARRRADIVAVSVYVNPLRFRTPEEFDEYPRRLDEDLELLDDLGVDVVFAPDGDALLAYDDGSEPAASGALGGMHEGFRRPGYFDGLLRVEAALLRIVEPDVAVYGLRDAQRVFLVRRMAEQLGLRASVEAIETVRTDDGLPISTRIGLLDAREREAAIKLARALEAAVANAERGADACVAAAQSVIMGDPRITIDYLTVVDPATFLPTDSDRTGPALALIAAEVGAHRFIDNAEVYLG